MTYFFNGGRTELFSGETQLLIPSPDVQTYDLKPEMSAKAVGDAVISITNMGEHGFIVVNFANGDMVGHTANLDAAIKAVEALDEQVGRIMEAAEKNGYSVVITADHGNCEEIQDATTGEPHTQHTINPVPCLIMDEERWQLLPHGGLANIAPTILQLMGLEQPATMTSGSLLLDPIGKSEECLTLVGAA